MIQAEVHHVETHWIVEARQARLNVKMDPRGRSTITLTEDNVGVIGSGDSCILTVRDLTEAELDAYSAAFARAAQLIREERAKSGS